MIDKSIKFFGINIAILTISDTRNFDNDKSGSTLRKLVEDYGHTCISRDIVKDEPKELLSIFNKWINNKNLDVIITTGGTGLTGRDITVDVLETYFDKKIDGFGELFRYISYKKIGTSTIQSRATAGTKSGKYIFCLPGSPSACKDAWEEILKFQLDIRHKPCNFVEIMPRLNEALKV
tara:strand:- start:186 stop:719 length:534 start_codon:yes stop_codon:yes gene_type:complete